VRGSILTTTSPAICLKYLGDQVPPPPDQPGYPTPGAVPDRRGPRMPFAGVRSARDRTGRYAACRAGVYPQADRGGEKEAGGRRGV